VGREEEATMYRRGDCSGEDGRGRREAVAG
jgi:hypothetical protein